MKKLATFINKHFPKLAMEIYYIIDCEKYRLGEELADLDKDYYYEEDLPF